MPHHCAARQPARSPYRVGVEGKCCSRNGVGLELKVVRASSEQDLSAVFDSLGRGNEEPLVIASDAFFSSHGEGSAL